MTVSKAVSKFAQGIIVDTAEASSLPETVRKSYLQGGASIPVVIVTDPAFSSVFARLDHPALKSQNYGTLFQPAQRAVTKAKRDGSFSLGDHGPKLEKIADQPVKKWTSKSGSTIEARLIGREGAHYVFERANGKQLRARAEQLSPTTVAALQKLFP